MVNVNSNTPTKKRHGCSVNERGTSRGPDQSEDMMSVYRTPSLTPLLFQSNYCTMALSDRVHVSVVVLFWREISDVI